MNQKKTQFVSVLTETVYDDGCYTALVRVYGYEFAAHYIAGEIRVHATQGMAYDKSPRWQKESRVKAVAEFAQSRISAQSAEWHQNHKVLYELDAA